MTVVQVKIRTVNDPFFGEDVPKYPGDPFEALLQPLLDQDTKQCDAWKDEVQNILILVCLFVPDMCAAFNEFMNCVRFKTQAGLFSAVVTAFIIESYQKLQPDSGDQTVALLLQISQQLATMQNATAVVTLASASDSSFVPSSSDVRINIFWFISLVLSLTVALVGIVTLQWLREHQRYDKDLNSKQRLAIYHARSQGLHRWFVPQIFATLPLLLQLALVLFFVGLLDFLIAIRTEVAIPVGIALGIPILFLAITTMMPTLQLFVVGFPYLLSVNYNPPSPCPYRSPQSLLATRPAAFSALFYPFACLFAAAYYPLVCIIRVLFPEQKPFREVSAPFYGSIDPSLKRAFRYLRQCSTVWRGYDLNWLAVRSAYVLATMTPSPLRCEDEDDILLSLTSLDGPSEFIYDCVEGVVSSMRYGTIYSSEVLYQCIEELVDGQCNAWDTGLKGDANAAGHQRPFVLGRYTALMGIFGDRDNDRLSTAYFNDRQVPFVYDANSIRNVYRLAFMSKIMPSHVPGVDSPRLRAILQRFIERQTRVMAPRLLGNVLHVFECAHICNSTLLGDVGDSSARQYWSRSKLTSRVWMTGE